MNRYVVPAAAGFFGFYIDVEDAAPYVDTSPVVAWLVDADPKNLHSETAPICAAGGVEHWHGVVYPDGRAYHYAEEETFDTLDRLVTELRARVVKKGAGDLA